MFFDWLDELLFHDPRKGLRWAKVTPDLALKTPEEKGPEGRQAHRERLVKAWAILGGAYRAGSQHDAADEAYAHAFKIIEPEAIGPMVRAGTEHRLSYLRVCQGRADEALELATGAVETLRQIDVEDDDDLAAEVALHLGEALISKGYVLTTELRRHAEAIDAFGEALILAGNSKGSDAKRRLHASACHNLAFSITASSSFGGHEKALGYIGKARELVKGQNRSVGRYRLLWVEGLVWNKAAAHAKTERLYRQALEGFEALELPYEIALVGLDLGAVLQLFGRWDELEELAVTTYQRFRVLAANTEAIAALSQWMDAVKARTLDEELFTKTRQILIRGVFSSDRCTAPRRGRR